jgi:hypothetical protein
MFPAAVKIPGRVPNLPSRPEDRPIECEGATFAFHMESSRQIDDPAHPSSLNPVFQLKRQALGKSSCNRIRDRWQKFQIAALSASARHRPQKACAVGMFVGQSPSMILSNPPSRFSHPVEQEDWYADGKAFSLGFTAYVVFECGCFQAKENVPLGTTENRQAGRLPSSPR